jgi:protein tyrosine phosphatase
VNYINASWIKNPKINSQPTEIACQGPVPHTIVHFLQMLVEQNVDAIVMLTKCAEYNTDGVYSYKNTLLLN